MASTSDTGPRKVLGRLRAAWPDPLTEAQLTPHVPRPHRAGARRAVASSLSELAADGYAWHDGEAWCAEDPPDGCASPDWLACVDRAQRQWCRNDLPVMLAASFGRAVDALIADA